MSKLVRRSHFDLFLRFRDNHHLQYRIRPGNFWNDIVSVHLLYYTLWIKCKNTVWFWCENTSYFGFVEEADRGNSDFVTNSPSVNFGNLRKCRRTADAMPSFSRTNIGSCEDGGSPILPLTARIFLKFFSRNRNSATPWGRWNASGTMATRNLTEIYINLRTEITRFKAYSLGDSVRSDSPGVL